MIFTIQSTKKYSQAGNAPTYKGAIVSICPWMSRTGVVTLGIPDVKRVALEKALGYAPGTLAPGSEFLTTYHIKLIDGKAEFDTSTPQGELAWEFLRNCPIVAQDPQHISAKHEYVIKNEDAEAQVANKKNLRKLDAMNHVSKLTPVQKRKALRLLGQNSTNMSDELVESRLMAAVETHYEEFFAKWVDNKDRDCEFLLETAVGLGIITKSRTTYRYGTDVLGSSKDDAIIYLNKKENEDLYGVIQSEITAKLELKN